ncbi:FecR family protein [Spongiimicrobium sp. 3-5]|uniref:FecR family protein n=1 Tax=Spongiimicrobium sp. 3-5 TaxID=3332596 RepID=UPI00397F9A49
MDFKIVVKKLNNSLTPEEEIIFDQWYNESDKHKQFFTNVKKNYGQDPELVDIEKGWSVIEKRIEKKRVSIPYWKYAVAASIALAVAVFYYTNSVGENASPTETMVTTQKTEIVPGSNKAVLTLEDGSEVALEEGKAYQSSNLKSNGKALIYETNAKPKAKEVVYNYLTVPRGGEFHIKLSDGTEVWLNSDSKLKYPVVFDTSSRRVELLYGEAYFDVSPSSEHNGSNFVVSSYNQDLEVLGTEFNVKAYKEDAMITTTLVEGSVRIDNGGNENELSPSQQSKINRITNEVSITEVDVYDEISWKNGLFSFKNKSLRDIMTVLSRWYDIDVEIGENTVVDEVTFNGVFNRERSIEEILKIIENTNEAKFEIYGKTVIMK